MSIRKVSESMKEQNALLVEMSQDNQKNSESLQQSIGELNAVLAGIHKVLSDQKKEDDTEKSREELQDKDKENASETEQGKSLFSGFLGGKNKEKGKGLLGGIFSKALGFLVKSLPLIGLAGLFFGDVVTGLLTAVVGDMDTAGIIKNVLAGGLIGSIFGFRGALIGAIIGLIFGPETREKLKAEFGKIVSIFESDGLLAALGALGPLASGLGMLAIALAPFRTMKMAWGALKGTLNLIGGLFGLKGIGAPKLPDGGKTPTTMAKAGSKVGGIVKAGTIGLASKLTPGFIKQGAAGALAKGKDVAETLAIKSMYAKDGAMSAIKSAPGKALGLGKAAAGGMAGVAGSAAKSAAGGVAKAATSAGAKTVLKKIPVIGALAGLGFGASRLIGGDVTGAGMEVLSGLASVVPGIGTAASLGIDAALIARDAGAFDKKSQEIVASRQSKGDALSEATREREELIAKTSSNIIMDNSTTNNVAGGGGGSTVVTSPISWSDSLDPFNQARV